jgi:hypothetical protein
MLHYVIKVFMKGYDIDEMNDWVSNPPIVSVMLLSCADTGELRGGEEEGFASERTPGLPSYHIGSNPITLALVL